MANNQLKAGFGKGVIRFPKELFPVEGFIGVHDDPCARLMVLASQQMQMAIVSMDMVNVPEKSIDLCQKIIEQKTGTPKEHIWIHVTHAVSTMHEPGPMGPPDRRPPLTERDLEQRAIYAAAIEKAVTEAAEQAADSLSDAKIGWGTGLCDVNVNRDVETPDGWWTGRNPEGISNKTMSVLRVEDLAGAPKGFLISYGVKPCALDNAGMETKDRQVSADICGVCSTMMEQKYGVPALFCVSAAGDQMPREQAWYEEAVPGGGRPRFVDHGVEKGLEIVARLGSVMGSDAIAIAEKTECNEREARMQYREVAFPWQTKMGRPRGPSAPVEEYRVEGECTVQTQIFSLGDAVFVAGKPEVNTQTERELLDRSPFAHTCLICMVNGGMKYIPDRLSYERNTFAAQSAMLLPGAAEHFVEVVAADLNQMAQQGEA